jgi:hypothetical protein
MRFTLVGVSVELEGGEDFSESLIKNSWRELDQRLSELCLITRDYGMTLLLSTLHLHA